MKYKIPLFKLNFNESEILAVTDTIKSAWISTGPKCEEFEQMFSEMLNVNHAHTTSNCTSALHLACRILGLKDGDEVICPSLTFAATVNAIKYVNAKPVFCDITSLENLNIDPNKIEKLITPQTKAIMVMHYAGFPCDMEAIVTLANRFNLKIIEDACHGPLSEFHDKKLGTIGDIGCFSFFTNKNISTGEGGMLVTNNPEISKKVKLLRSHGMTTLSYQRSKGHSSSYDIIELGYNYRMDDIHASIGIAQLNKIKYDLEFRREVRKNYEIELEKIPGVIVPFCHNQEFVSNYIMPIVLKNSSKDFRNEVRQYLEERGIQTSVHYPSVHLFSIYKEHTTSLPLTEYVSDNLITLPMYASLTTDEIKYIGQTLAEIVKR
ncbi:MAG: DegT/DnrJ/EryC1/StrS family aminotransferase [Bacteroidales bacterium]|nr:DegT/DnrJ/EryC1/StrS family aminotransferase [Bacteroidales bacterium]